MIEVYGVSVLEGVLRKVLLDKVTLALEQILEWERETKINVWGKRIPLGGGNK